MYFIGEGKAVEFSEIKVEVDKTSWTLGKDYQVVYSGAELNTKTNNYEEKLTIKPIGDKEANYSEYNSDPIILSYLNVDEKLSISEDQLDGASDEWYNGDVTLSAPAGYKFEVKNSDGNWEEKTSDSYTDEGKYKIPYRLISNNDNSRTSEKDISFNIDKTNPVVKDINVLAFDEEGKKLSQQHGQTKNILNLLLWKIILLMFLIPIL